MAGGGSGELGQGDGRTGHRLSLGGIDREALTAQPGQVDDHSVPHVAPTHRTPGAAGNQRHAVIGGPLDHTDEILVIDRQADGPRQNTIDPGAFGIGRAGPRVLAVYPFDVRRQHGPKLTIFSPMAELPRAQLIHINVDRRLGHEWDEWDGRPLPNQGNYDSPPALFFAWSAVTLAVGLGVVACVLYLLTPRLRTLHAGLPALL